MTTTTKSSKTVTVQCPKCSGKGRLNWTNIESGRCFTCGGCGTVNVDAPAAAASRAKAIVVVKSWLDADATDPDYIRDLAYAIKNAPRDVGERAIAAACRRTTVDALDLDFLRRHLAA
jgi:endogenous inhibitor of DNA gyrase (YacG/DUF329 family)